LHLPSAALRGDDALALFERQLVIARMKKPLDPEPCGVACKITPKG
jgi:hypothetical protein